MLNKDQFLLEKAYQSIYEHEEEKLIKPDPGYLPLKAVPEQNKKECICGSGKPFYKCCGSRSEIGDVVCVLTQADREDLDFSRMLEPYKSMWKKAQGKCGILVGRKDISFDKIYKPKKTVSSAHNFPIEIAGVKMLDGNTYDIDWDLIGWPTVEQLETYRQKTEIKKIEDEFPEVKGTLGL